MSPIVQLSLRLKRTAVGGDCLNHSCNKGSICKQGECVQVLRGNNAIHTLTKDGNQELRIELQRFNGEKAFAQYSTFSLGSEDTYFKLYVSGYSGTAGDSLAYHNKKRFSTKDNDAAYSGRRCATERHGAWWYYYCSYSNLNAKYRDSVEEKGPKYMIWNSWKGGGPLKETMMMIRGTH
ncbi:ficolin-3-like [Saccostrea echinata]|uniref:ficolin-3-like n=1 Tax=Saccostrea echinata TaxID=191078 RepID=UPI002A7EC20E|nr:ficolin-3-like [Saccostrea echinata]